MLLIGSAILAFLFIAYTMSCHRFERHLDQAVPLIDLAKALVDQREAGHHARPGSAGSPIARALDLAVVARKADQLKRAPSKNLTCAI